MNIAPIEVYIPGPPCAQGRGRAGIVRGKGGVPILKNGQPIVRVHDPKKSKSWKGSAQVHMLEARGGRLPLEGPVELCIVAVFPCPASSQRKRSPVPRRYHAARPDADNVAKAVKDAASGVLYHDDGQVARLTIEKHRAAQGEAPHVHVIVSHLPTEVHL